MRDRLGIKFTDQERVKVKAPSFYAAGGDLEVSKEIGFTKGEEG